MAINGSCLCGSVEYSLTAPPLQLGNCHCSMCRKAHGSAYATFAKLRRANFRFTAGEDLIKRYQSSAEIERSFCQQCGAKLTFEWSRAPEFLWLAAGTLDDDPELRPQYHVFTDSKADWHDINDNLPRHEAYPPLGD